ncbi:MAG: glucose dehydrogenase, partial [Oscillochloris sp.]|nr:glucose dehydrogenase [Oscillochloris sp.]
LTPVPGASVLSSADATPPMLRTGGSAPTLPPSEASVTPSALPSEASATPLATISPSPSLSVRLELVVDNMNKPTFISGAGDNSGRLFVVEQIGRIWTIRDGARLEQPFLDISAMVGSSGSEQGLLGLAFHPRYAENGIFFVDYTDTKGDTVLARYHASQNSDLADPASADVLLQVEQPAANHNGGQLAFGPDGYLYVALGDGGGGGDTYGNGQNLGTLLGTILRLDVDGAHPYAIPTDNPFVDREGARAEIWAWGLRNPWRFSFDRATGDLYIADVGQGEVEEIDVQPVGSSGGENYGWNIMEGSRCYAAEECDQTGLTLPVASYEHSADAGGCSITGGYVYRGTRLPQIVGQYFYSDFCSGNLWALQRQGEGWHNQFIGNLGISPSSFGEDDAGELYVADHSGGAIYRVVIE